MVPVPTVGLLGQARGGVSCPSCVGEGLMLSADRAWPQHMGVFVYVSPPTVHRGFLFPTSSPTLISCHFETSQT